MQDIEIIKKKLKAIDNLDYASYQSLAGEYTYPGFTLLISRIPKDPYAPPHTGLYCIRIPQAKILPEECVIDTKVKEIASRDFLARQFYHTCMNVCKGRRGTGYSGVIIIEEPGQVILERSSVVFDNTEIEIRFFIGLPASGRMINSRLAEEILCTELPEIVFRAFDNPGIDCEKLTQHLNTAVDAEYLRSRLGSLGLVAFIADNALLPRESGTSDKPLNSGKAVPFQSPESLKLEVILPYKGAVSGMGIPKGVTLIAGGGYHGKTTLLKAIESGIYNHIPGDGREQCVSLSSTVKVRSYSGRYVVKTDISAFIKNLPLKKDTTGFSTENASGSTSQAASISESIEMGTGVLLMDEDTCATNFMIRDAKMQQLVRKEDEPITAFIDKVRQLYEEKSISTILVLGGIGDYFDVSDHVIQMIRYVPSDVTEKARKISENSPMQRKKEVEKTQCNPKARIPMAASIDPCNQYGKKGIYAKETSRINFGKTVIDLTDVEQLIELGQIKAIGLAIDYAKKYMDGNSLLHDVVNRVMHDLKDKGFDILDKRISGNYAEFRGLELAFAINRLRGFEVKQKE